MKVLLIRSASVAQCRRQIERQRAECPGCEIDLLCQPAVRAQFSGSGIGRFLSYEADRFGLFRLLAFLPAIRAARYDKILIPDNGVRGLSYTPLARFALLCGAGKIQFVAQDGACWSWRWRDGLASLGLSSKLLAVRLMAVPRILLAIGRAVAVRRRGRGVCLLGRCATSNFSTRVRVTYLAPELQALGIPSRQFYPATPEQWRVEQASCRGPLGDRRYQLLLWGKYLRSRLAALVEGARMGAIYIENEALCIHAMPPLIEILSLLLVPRVIFELDDAYFHDRRYAFWLSRLYRRADLVVVSGPHLQQFAERYARKVVLVPMGIELSEAPPRRIQPDRLVLGWCGSACSLSGLQEIQPALREFLAAHPHATLEIASGSDPGDLLDLPYRFVQLEDGRELEPLSRWDIGLVPTEATPFNRGRCVYKLLQYLAAGVCPLSSEVGDNLGFFREGPDLQLAREDEWLLQLSRLASDPQLRSQLVARGRAVLLRQFDQQRVGPRLASAVAGMVA